jgi:signal transduction histidine kinase
MPNKLPNERERLGALHRLHILDTPPEKSFDDLAQLASVVCGAPVSLITLVDKDRQWFKARVGIDRDETPRDQAFCAHTILDAANLTVVEDATRDARFLANPLVTGDPNIRFYAGAPLVMRDGHSLGSLCVIDRVPRSLTAEQLEALAIIRDQVVREIESRRFVTRAQSSLAELESVVGHKSAEIAQQAESLQTLAMRLLAVQDDERRRIARELHDSAGQLLAGAIMSLDAATNDIRSGRPPALDMIQECRELLLQLTTEIRTMSYLLHPPMLDEAGLAVALEVYAQGIQARSGLRVTLDVPPDFRRLPAEFELAMFRVVQECLTNVHRHSGSESAHICVEDQGDEIILDVEDKGRGIAAEKLVELQKGGGGVGTQGMRERVHEYGGNMEISSSSRGTRVRFRFPIPAGTPALR